MGEVLSIAAARERRQARRDEPWVSKAEIARHLGVSKRQVSRYMQAGLPFRKRFEGSHPKFQVSAVDDWMDGR